MNRGESAAARVHAWWVLRVVGIAIVGLAAFRLVPWWVIPIVGVPLVLDAFNQLGKSMG